MGDWTKEKYRQLAELAVSAGTLMLENGAETYRVEDTINHILGLAEDARSSSFVITTAVTLTLEPRQEEMITLVRRVNKRGTNLNIIYAVNQISRELCSYKLTMEEAWERLKQVDGKTLYSSLFQFLGQTGVVVGFAGMLGGSPADVAWSLLVGLLLAGSMEFCNHSPLNTFFKNVFCASVVAFLAMIGEYLLPGQIQSSIIITSGIMPLVPGIAFTNGIRDLLYGDYTAATARIMEALVVGTSIAIGVGIGMAISQL